MFGTSSRHLQQAGSCSGDDRKHLPEIERSYKQDAKTVMEPSTKLQRSKTGITLHVHFNFIYVSVAGSHMIHSRDFSRLKSREGREHGRES